MTLDDFIKIMFSVSGCFAIVGISVQIIRLLGGLVISIRQLNHTLANTNSLTDKLVEDYDFISSQIKNIVNSVSQFTENVFVPLTNLLGVVKKLENLPFIGDKIKSKRYADED